MDAKSSGVSERAFCFSLSATSRHKSGEWWPFWRATKLKKKEEALVVLSTIAARDGRRRSTATFSNEGYLDPRFVKMEPDFQK